MVKIAIIGYKGKMGSVVANYLSGKYEIVGIDINDNLQLAKSCDIIVDFSNGENSANVALWAKQNDKKLIIGSTGQNKKDLAKIEKVSESVPVIISGNFSLGIFRIKTILKKLITDDLESVCIIEKHHKNKKDSPSGTALELKEVIKDLGVKKIDVVSVRGGKEIGTHEIDFYYTDEVIKIVHQAFSRNAFAFGVEQAINYLSIQDEPGLYTFNY